jgi:hypothetical protein
MAKARSAGKSGGKARKTAKVKPSNARGAKARRAKPARAPAKAQRKAAAPSAPPMRVKKAAPEVLIPEIPPPLPAPIASFTF